ncbi:MAG TPA: methionine ABC transporter ATP-binding protein [Herpetosiphonaceae bacterium]
MIQLTDLHKIYHQPGREVVALDGVSLEVKPGEIFGVLGQSGAGKSTLIRCVNLLERPTSGSVKVGGQELTTLPAPELRAVRQQIGMIFQHFNLLSSRTVAENVAFPLEVIGYDRAKRAAKVADLLALVGLEDRASAYPSQLSGGQKQRVGIARALAGDPKVLLSDEATSALDPQTTRSILELLRDLNQRLGLTILLITHEMSVVKSICDSVAVMSNGRIVEQGPVVDVIARADSRLAAEFFPQLRNHTARPGTVLVNMTFVGDAAEQPILTTLARKFDLDANILGGSIETIADRRVGQLQVELSGDRQQLDPALRFLRDNGLRLEVLA